MLEKVLEQIYNSRKEKIFQVLEFIEKYKLIKDKIHFIENAKSLINNESAKEIIRILFIDCLNAAGGNNLTLNGKSSKYFYSKLEKLSDNRQIELTEFFNCFDNSISNYTDLFDYLHKSSDLKNFGKKKSALFIYKLDWLQQNLESDKKIFKKYQIDKTELIIPLDVVIVLILNKLLNLEKENVLNQYKDFDLINSFFKSKLGERFILIEDLWFWGFFTTKGSGTDRKIEFNDDKFYTAEFLKPTDQNKRYIIEFLRIIEDKKPAANTS